MSKLITIGWSAREKILNGVRQLAEVVCVTLGPLGSNVIIDKKWIYPVVLHDGVSVAKEIELSDPEENAGAQLVKEAALKTNDRAGDGTTTATLLVYKLIEKGFDLVDAGTNPMILKKGIDFAVSKVVEELKKISRPLNTKSEIAQIATISSADPVIGNLIADAMEKIGKDGAMVVEEGSGVTTEVIYKEGMELDKGLVTPLLALDQDKLESELENPYILLTDLRLGSLSEMMEFLQRIHDGMTNKDLVIVADHVEGEALKTLYVNHQRGVIHCIAVQAPAIGERQKDILGDIAALTGAKVILRDMGDVLDNVQLEHLGRAQKVVADMNKITFVGGSGDRTQVQTRIVQIKSDIKKTSSLFEAEKLRERLARLSSGVAIFKVGAPTEQELKEKKERVIDAVEATKSAVEEGIIAGGGRALVIASTKIDGYRPVVTEGKWHPDFTAGVNLVQDVLSEPFKKILENAGVESLEVITKINQAGYKEVCAGYGYDIVNEKYGNMFTLGVIDPLKVTRLALENAASVAANLLTANAIVTDLPEKNDKTTLG